MELSLIERLARESVRVLPGLRELSVELWPRDPTRKDKDDWAWGGQTVRLLEVLTGGFEARRWRVVVDFRWEGDCVRFEDEYVGVRGWREVGVGGEDVGGEDGGMCRRSYELKGRGI